MRRATAPTRIEHRDVSLAEHGDVELAVGTELHAVGPLELGGVEVLDDVAEGLARSDGDAIAARVAVDVAGQRLGDVEVAVRTERDAVRELQAAIEQLDRRRLDVDAIHAAVVAQVALVGVELAAGRELVEQDAGVRQVQIAVRSEREVVQEQEPLAVDSGSRMHAVASVERQLEQGALVRLGDPDHPVAIAREPVGPAGTRRRARACVRRHSAA